MEKRGILPRHWMLCLLPLMPWLDVGSCFLSPSGINYEVVALMAMKIELNDLYNVPENCDINSVDPCSWRMVTCSAEGYVSVLGLPSQILSGTLSPCIGNLTNLQSVLLQNNAISGPIPDSIGRLEKLRTLDLSNNHFSGSIPVSLGGLTNLNYLRLNNNSLSGACPDSLSTVKGFTLLDLSFNNLRGPFPKLFARTFNIDGNSFICAQNSGVNCSSLSLDPISYPPDDLKELEVPGFVESQSRNGLSDGFFPEHKTSSPHSSCQVSTPYSHAPVCRQFWKAGEYPADDASHPVLKTGQNRMRVHPKFLHSNATSHKWAFGAIAELLDNTVDEVCNGATMAIIDKISNLGNNHALLIQDNGGGMDPESIRHCLSFGFSDKQANTAIGHYGNGFKSSTMRLGADVIVFSRCLKESKLTQSVGILSYTFLRQAGCNDIIVPMVDYTFDLPIRGFTRLLRYSEKHFCENLSIILRWSPYAKEEELLDQFNYIGDSGTRIIVYNLWQNDNGYPELDFDTNEKDILISGALNVMHNSRFLKDLNEKHIGNCFRYSLRAYSSILYLRLPENFRIFLREYLVVPHYVAEDLIYTQVINYRPQIGRTIESEVIGTVIGFLNGAPNLEIHGFNIYHRNRLILPFWRVVNKCKGVVGVLQVECLKPTHDKQDFEKSDIFIKLEIRLKEMAMEYWKYHHHLVGYTATKMSSSTQLPPGYQMYHPETTEISQETFPKRKRKFHANLSASSQAEPPEEENTKNNTHEIEARKKQLVTEAIAPTKQKIQIQGVGIRDRLKAITTMIKRRQHLKVQFMELKNSVEELTKKEKNLRHELEVVELVNNNLYAELKSFGRVKMDTF